MEQREESKRELAMGAAESMFGAGVDSAYTKVQHDDEVDLADGAPEAFGKVLPPEDEGLEDAEGQNEEDLAQLDANGLLDPNAVGNGSAFSPATERGRRNRLAFCLVSAGFFLILLVHSLSSASETVVQAGKKVDASLTSSAGGLTGADADDGAGLGSSDDGSGDFDGDDESDNAAYGEAAGEADSSNLPEPATTDTDGSASTLPPTVPFHNTAAYEKAWDYALQPSGNEPVKVCLMTMRKAPQKASLFLRDYLRHWGSELQFYIEEAMDKTLEEYFKIGQISREDLNPPVFGKKCDPSWPQLWLLRRPEAVHAKSQALGGPKIVVGDETCGCSVNSVCDATHEEASAVAFRQYYSTSYKIDWLPLGPRFEWKRVHPSEIKPASKRRWNFNFMGSLTSASRNTLVDLLENKKLLATYPVMKTGKLEYRRRWNKFIVNKKSYANPTDYRRVILDSVFTLCPAGQSPEAFRIFEAIDAGSIPVFSLDKSYWSAHCQDPFKPFLDSGAPFVIVNHWSELPPILEKLVNQPGELDRMQMDLAKWRASFWGNVTRKVDCSVMTHFKHLNPNAGEVDLDRFCAERKMPHFELPPSVHTAPPTPPPTAKALVVAKPESWNHPVWGLPGPAEAEPIKVCLQTIRKSPQKASIFLRNYFRRWGSRLDFVVQKELMDEMKEYYEVGQISRDDLSPETFTACPPEWPQLWLLLNSEARKDQRGNKKGRDGPLMVVGDETCGCSPSSSSGCGPDAKVRLRNYFSSDYKIEYMPIGPRFEWKPVDPSEIIPATERTHTFNFQGSLTSSSRQNLISVLENGKNLEAYPSLKRGVVEYHKRFNKFLVSKAYAKPSEYRATVLNSTFTLCPVGGNPESFRIFEAIDAGSIPVLCLDNSYWNAGCHDAFQPFLETHAPFVVLQNWDEWPEMLEKLVHDKDALMKRQEDLAAWRVSFWQNRTKALECEILKFHNARLPSSNYDLGDVC